MFQPKTNAEIRSAVTKHGVAQGPQKLFDVEEEAAEMALRSGVYCTFQTRRKRTPGSRRVDDCSRVGPKSLCFCGCTYAKHMRSKNRRKPCSTKKCKCKGYLFIPQRPEECGDWWLTRRAGFNVNTWRCKCRCGCP